MCKENYDIAECRRKLFVCNACDSYTYNNKIPPQSSCNEMTLETQSQDMRSFNWLEQPSGSKILAFSKSDYHKEFQAQTAFIGSNKVL